RDDETPVRGEGAPADEHRVAAEDAHALAGRAIVESQGLVDARREHVGAVGREARAGHGVARQVPLDATGSSIDEPEAAAATRDEVLAVGRERDRPRVAGERPREPALALPAARPVLAAREDV